MSCFNGKSNSLGRQVSQDGVEMGDSYIKAVKNWTVPKTSKDVEKFLGFANYHRTFIKGFSQMAAPLYKLTGKGEFEWQDEQQCKIQKN